MDPYQQQQPAQPGLPPPTSNPYEFIMNPQKQQKPKAGGLMRMLVFVVGGAVVLVVFLVVIVSLMSNKAPSVSEDLVSITQIQQELIRVSHQGASDSTQQTTKNLAITAEYAIQTQQNATVSYLAQHGRALAKNEVGLKRNAQTDQQFSLAKSTSTFDLVFSTTMQNSLTDYATSLKTVFTRTANQETKAMLSDYYDQTQLLISQVPYTQEKIESAGNTTQ